ncbi:YdcF family protein [Phenylobacterium sp. J426]|uniref:YdcF family protein n=1 Tax=Phenylobacterium sp. J426 TaxID=2898439 RepID=UPI002151A4A0|nr:YdcF family protein [Phenylobacterium sp. J426]MCR5876077.1 YdcF family protein [Phenylobacterium sp. J426]
MTGPPLIAIFGAAVLPQGPSPSLLRRIGYGLAAAQAYPEAPVLCSGGVGRFGPSEASVMVERLLAEGVTPQRLIQDDASLDTLQSVAVAARWVRRTGASRVMVCSDAYHVPRIRMMLGVLSVASEAGPRLPGRGGASLGNWMRMTLREGLAIPYDLALVLARRRELAGEGASAS